MIPAATVVGLLVNPTNPAARTLSRGLEAAARTLGLQLDVLQGSTERDIDDASATLVRRQASALVIVPDALFNSQSEQLGALTLRHAVPTVFQYRAFVAAGGLMSYTAVIPTRTAGPATIRAAFSKARSPRTYPSTEPRPVGRSLRGIEKKNPRPGGSILCRGPLFEQRTLGGPLALKDQ